MTTRFRLDVPYESQVGSRMCGAAALSMVYQSLGQPCTQAEVWPSIGREGANGEWGARTYLLCADARRRGFFPLMFRARNPWAMLAKCGDPDLRVILNHRSSSGRMGHFSVLVGMEDEVVVVHDPQIGQDRRLSRSELLDLWKPDQGVHESKGQVGIAICRRPPDGARADCSACGKPLPAARTCPICEMEIPLHPGALLGCGQDGCSVRVWDVVYCWTCDCGVR